MKMKSGKYTNLVKDTIVFGIGSLGSKLILFIMVPLYTNCMTTDEYGIAELVFTVAQFLSPFFSVVIFDAIVRFGLSKSEKKENVILVGFITTLIGSCLMIVTTPFLSLYKPISPWKWYLCFYVIFNMFNSVEMCYIKAKEKNKVYSFLSIIQTVAMATLNVILLIILKWGIRGYLVAYIGASLIVDIIALFLAKIPSDLKKSKFDKRLMVEMIKYSSPLILNNVSWWIIHSSDKVMVERMVSATALGLYTVAAKIPSLINVIVTIFQQAWGISAVKEVEGTNDTSFYSKVFRFLTFFTTLVCIFIVLIIKIFMKLYVGKEFFSSWVYVPLLLNSAVYASMAGYFGSLYGALKKSVNNMATTMLAAIVNIIANFALIPFIGIWGAVIGTLVSYIVIAFVRMYDVRKTLFFEIDFKILLINYLIMSIQAILVSLDFHIYVSSTLLIVLFLYINRSDIFKMLKMRRNE